MSSQRLWTLICLLWIVTTSVADADEAKAPTKSPDAVQTLTVDPRAVERPLLKYRLFPAEFELRNGNAAPILLRLPWDNAEYFATVVPKFKDLVDLPYDDPKIRNAGDLFRQGYYLELRRAAFHRNADWEYPIGEEPLGGILLPDVQGARDIAGRGLSIWIGHRIAIGSLAEAREGILVGLAVSRLYARTPFLITQLVCAQIDAMMLVRLEELICQPECPNLYWALTTLPRPLIDLGPSVELEQKFVVDTIPGFNNLEAVESEEQWTAHAVTVIDQMRDRDHRLTEEEDSDAQKQLLERVAKQARAADPAWMDGDTDRIGAMPDSEAAVRWLLHHYEDRSQQSAAIMALEPPVAILRLAQLEQDLRIFHSELGFSTLFVLARPLRVYLNIYKIQRRIDALRVVEAIRHYAATHESQLPTSLDQITETPVPDDPLTGQPFHYELSEGAAILRADGFDIDGKEIGAIHYRIQLQDGSE